VIVNRHFKSPVASFSGPRFGSSWQSAEEGRDDTNYPDEREDEHLGMETQFAEEKGELLFELREKTTTVTIKDFTPAGVRSEYNLQGQVKGKFEAMHLETVTVLGKPDGTFEFEVKGINATNDGDTVLITNHGKGWQDTPATAKFQSEDTYQTNSRKLAWLNSMKTQSEGTYNFVTGELEAKTYSKK